MRLRVLWTSLLLTAVIASPISPASATTWTLPIHSATPGAIDPIVTQENIGSTICVVGYTKTVRPPVSYTNALKSQQLRTTYVRYGTTDRTLFEEDHLIPLAVGGAPRDARNLWPEPWSGSLGARKKDVLELKMHLMVCAQQITLKAAQAVFATNWYQGYLKYVVGK